MTAASIVLVHGSVSVVSLCILFAGLCKHMDGLTNDVEKSNEMVFLSFIPFLFEIILNLMSTMLLFKRMF